MKTHDVREPWICCDRPTLRRASPSPPPSPTGFISIVTSSSRAPQNPPSPYFVTSGSGKTVRPPLLYAIAFAKPSLRGFNSIGTTEANAPPLLLIGSISIPTSSSSRARQTNYPTIQNPRPAPRIQFQIYFDMSVRAKGLRYFVMPKDSKLGKLCQASRLLALSRSHSQLGDRATPTSLDQIPTPNTISPGVFPQPRRGFGHCEITGFNGEPTPSPSLGIDASSVSQRLTYTPRHSTQRERLPDRSPLTIPFDGDLRARSELDLKPSRHLPLKARLPGGYISGRLRHRLISHATSPSFKFPRHQDLISVGMPHTRLQIRDWNGR
ncbi:hypothetical protein DFP72DRAFT_848844 [Ephemerocybe angulata]|uniref:Uncharacterized protein n=1 Tax=Ephemerocybe angulata TaxID=980116 RepID=A0A8H6M6H1_9AGAR|nr:hypothetical protein DFP72DRAFT_848844 [Tulosesus angulatus]